MKIKKDKLAEVCGVDKRTIYNWRTQRPKLLRYVELGLEIESVAKESELSPRELFAIMESMFQARDAFLGAISKVANPADTKEEDEEGIESETERID